MSWPLGELKALSTKAARGAGFSWSLAEEAGYATQWLEAHGVAGTKNLANYLEWIKSNGLPAAPIDMLSAAPNVDISKCPIALGCLIADSSMLKSQRAVLVKQAALVLPFLALAAGDSVISCKTNTATLMLSAAGIDKSALDRVELNLDEAMLSWQLADNSSIEPVVYTRVSDNAASIKRLVGFADKTYAPATEASRMAGAGAGTTDND